MAINISGLISGIDTDTIVSGLLEIQQQQIDQFNSRKTTVQTKQAAYQTLEAQITSFRSTVSQLSRSQNSTFDARTITVSHADSVVATANSRAAVGNYQITINSLAQAHQVASQGLGDADSEITQGTLTLRMGSQPAAEIIIDSTNNTLSGLADAINFANVGVTASIVQDESGARLLLTGSQTGVANAITIDNDLAASSGGAVRPEFDFDNPVQAAQDAQIKLGNGTGAIVVNKSTNQVNDLISGVNLNLLAADTGKVITIGVAQNVESAVQAVQDFVNAYNGVLDLINNLTRYDSDTQEAGVLLGDRSINQIKNELQSAVQAIVPGLPRTANRLSAIGINTGDDGKLVVNTTRLNDAVSGKVSGVTSSDLRKLFSLDGTSSTGNIQYVLGSTRTADSTTPYQVNITQAAERGAITAGGVLAGSTVIDSSNNELTLNLDGVDLAVTIAEGTYTATELAEALEKVINSHPSATGRAISAGVSGSGQLTLSSDSYGTSSRVAIVSGSALSALGLSGGEADSGVDVAGHFIVNGQVEAATGRGRLLSGNADNTFTADLQIRVLLSPSQVTGASEGEMTITRGIGSRLDKILGSMLDSQTGTFASVDETYNSQIESIQKSIDRQQASFDRQQEDIIAQFTALETAIASMQNTSSLLGAQLTSISNLSSSS